MLNEAIEKLQVEMNENPENGYIQLIGQYMIDHVEANPATAEKILADDKSVGGSLKFMEGVARNKERRSQVVMLTPEEGFKAVLDYYGIEDVKKPDLKVIHGSKGSSKRKRASIDLDDLL